MIETPEQIECALAADRVFHAFCGMSKAEQGFGIAMYAEQAGYADTIVNIAGYMMEVKPSWIGAMDRYLEAEGVNRPDVARWYEQSLAITKARREHYRTALIAERQKQSERKRYND